MTGPRPGQGSPWSDQAWRGGRDVTGVEALDLVRDRFPDLAAQRVEHVGTGWDNTAFRVDGQWLFRFPRRQQGADLTDRELLVLPRVEPRLPLAVPTPVLLGEPGEDFPWRFTGGRFVPGQEWWRAPPSAEQSLQAASTLAAALAVLHAPGTTAALPDVVAALPVDPNRRSEPVERVRRAQGALTRLADLLPGLLDPTWLSSLVERAEAGPRSPRVLVHGDLHVRHVLVQDGRLSGLIDWGDVCLAEPSVDLMVAFALFDGPARAAFLRRYGPVDDGVLDRARVLAITLHLTLADQALDQGEHGLVQAALDAVARAGRP